MSRAAGNANNTAQAFLNEREHVVVKIARRSPVFVIGCRLARIVDDPTDHIRLGKDARCHSAVRICQFHQLHFRRAQRCSGVWLQRRPDPQTPGHLQDTVNPNLLCDPNRDGISGFRQRLPEGDHALELTIIV